MASGTPMSNAPVVGPRIGGLSRRRVSGSAPRFTALVP